MCFYYIIQFLLESSERKKKTLSSVGAILLFGQGWNGSEFSFHPFLLVNVYQVGFPETCWRIRAGNQDKPVGGTV